MEQEKLQKETYSKRTTFPDTFFAIIQIYSYLLFWWASAYTCPVVFEEVFGAVLDAGGAVGVLAVGVLLPLVLVGVVGLHGWALLLANAVVVEVLTRLNK